MPAFPHNYHFFRGFIFLLLCAFGTPLYGQQPAADSSIVVNDTLLLRVEQINTDLNNIDLVNQKIISLRQIRNHFSEVKENSFQLQSEIGELGKGDLKTLLNYQVFIKDLQQQLSGWKTYLTTYTKQLQQNSDKIIAYSGDSLLNTFANTTYNTQYAEQIKELQAKIKATGNVTLLCLDSANALQTEIAALFLKNGEIQSSLANQLNATGKNALSRESPYIWHAPKHADLSLAQRIKASYKGQNKIISYFIEHSWDNRLLLLFLGICFFVWVFRNFRLLKQADFAPVNQQFHPKYLSRLPVLQTLIVILNLSPLVEQGSPSIYIEVIQFILLVLLSVFFYKHWERRLYYLWLAVVLLYLVVTITNSMASYGIYMRLCLLLVNGIAIYYGIHFLKGIEEDASIKRFVNPVSKVYIALNVMAIAFNIFGRISLAKLFSTTASMALSQIIGLSAFVRIMTEALDLQLKISVHAGGLLKRFNAERVCSVFTRMFVVLATVLWLVVFFINLNIFEALYTYLGHFLSKQRNIGSLSFTIGNITMFLVIIYFSSFLQKHIPTFFGEQHDKLINSANRKASKLVLLKLVIFIIGFLLAVVSLGLPLDKLTVILGALSVGIGLGLQNIVNNFVSGIILIFEKPFQIGDFIEIGDKTGRVQDIGIRSSRITTRQGSEVIVPNGDLLSGRLVNWTLSNNYLKTTIVFKVNADAYLHQITDIVNTIISDTADVLKNSPVEIAVSGIAGDAAELNISFWITNIYSDASVKSNILLQLYGRLKEKNIKML